METTKRKAPIQAPAEGINSAGKRRDEGKGSDQITEQQLIRMLGKIVLLFEIRLRRSPQIVTHQRDRNDQGDLPPAITLDEPQHFAVIASIQIALKKTKRVLQRIGVMGARGRLLQGLHQLSDVMRAAFGDLAMPRGGDVSSERPVRPLVVRQHDQLVTGMEVDQ